MMTDRFCTYEDRREDVLISYLYNEIDPVLGAAFERHLPTCPVCRSELEALGVVRDGLARWAAPDVAEGVGGRPERPALRLVETGAAPKSGWRVLAEAPVWMQAAAAMLVVAASLGLANINLTVSTSGVSMTTGWMQPAAPAATQAAAVAPAPAPVAPVSAPEPPSVASNEAWRAELAALETRLRTELKSQPVAATASDEVLLTRVKALLQESERRQQSELALRVAEVARDAQVQRQADLVKIDRSLGLIQNRTGVEVMRTQQQLNSLAQRVSQQR